jgi:hypothetical protein
MSLRSRLWIVGAVLLAVTALSFGCAEPVEDINRVQPHYISKSSLDGEWYYRQTLVDRPPEYAAGWAGIERSLEKIRWEVRERQLIAYRTHPAVDGVEDDDVLPGAEYKGDPVAVFMIKTHFDIICDFSSSTGK